MEAIDLRVQLEASRRFELEVRGIKFKLKIPSETAWRHALEANRDRHGRYCNALATRSILELAIVGWEGLKAKHILPTSPNGEDDIKFSNEALSMLLEDAIGIMDELAFGLMDRRLKRDEERETAQKN